MIEKQGWKEEARCKGVDRSIFFPNFKVEADWKATAAEVCKDCPVKAECLEWAVTHDEIGLWAGTTTQERSRLRKERGLRRPAISQVDPKPCGTDAAYARHRRAGETPCESCKAAHRLAQKDSSARKTAAFCTCDYCGTFFQQRTTRTDASPFCSDTCGSKYRYHQKKVEA